MAVPTFDISTFVRLYLPPNYRLPKMIAAVQSFLYGLIWRKKVTDAYMDGDTQLEHDISATYNTGDKVQYN